MLMGLLAAWKNQAKAEAFRSILLIPRALATRPLAQYLEQVRNGIYVLVASVDSDNPRSEV